MSALSRIKCIRLLVAFGVCLMLAGPVMLLWASRTALAPKGTGDDALGQAFDQTDAMLAARIQLPPVTQRPEGFAVFGDAFKVARRVDNPKGMLRTNFADIDPANVDAALRDLPANLRFNETEITRVGSKGTLAPGVNYIMLKPEAVAARSLDTVLGRLREQVKTIIGYGPNSTILAYVEPRHFGALRQNDDVKFFFAMQPADKIELQTGRRPLIQRDRALDPNFLMEIALVPGSDYASVKDRLEKIPGVAEVTNYGFDGSGLLAKVDRKSLDQVARIPEILNLQEYLELMDMNAKNGPTMQVGSVAEGLQIRPFDDLGVDGGGLDTNGDGQRNNVANNPDQVPPQIVAVIDNGISADTPSFSQTAAAVFDLAHPFPSPQHRKVHSIIPTRDNGSDCDAILDGGGSHGNTVASVIAAYPSQLGAFANDANKTVVSGQIHNANLDGVARGARIIVTDVADRTRCTANALIEKGGNVDPGRIRDRLNELICPKISGTGTGLCSGVVGGANEVHLAITPFGAPDNFQTAQFLPTNGTYPQQSADVDTFLYNNRDFMVVAPVGNNGALIGSNRPELWLRVIPDLFNGTAADDCPVPCTSPHPQPIQIPPPSTAKNLISVGVSRSDCFTVFGNNDCQSNHATFSSRGPASPESLRMAPIVFAPGSDLIGNNFETASIAVFRSRDDNNDAPIDAQIDEGNFGSSYSAANVTGSAAIIRDYFAQGLYPTGDRVAGNRVPNVSGALVKAAIIASAKFGTNVRTQGEDADEKPLRRTRAMDVGSPAGVFVGVMGNSEQGYGLPILTQVLPIPNWSKSFVLGLPFGQREPAGVSVETLEHPARALLIWDDIATGEPAIDNTHTSQTHTFKVSSPDLATNATGGLAVNHGEMRIAVAWTDPPSPAGTGGPLVNDLDLVVESPGPDNCLSATDTKPDGTACPATAANDNQFYDGNVYPGTQNQYSDQWSKLRAAGQTETHDCRNPQEAVHLTWDLSNDADATKDSQIFVGTWRVTVKRSTTSANCPAGSGGSTPGLITVTGPNEDTGNTLCTGAGTPFACCTGAAAGTCTGDRRLEDQNTVCTAAGAPLACCTGPFAGTCPTEDANHNGLLDLGGQTYALLVSGPVFHDPAEAPPAKGPTAFPASGISLDKIRYGCSENLVTQIFDGSGGGASQSTASTTFTVRNAAGTILDSESGIVFTAGSIAGVTTSAGVPIRLSSGPATPNNGILEADTGTLVFATYAPAGQAGVAASAQVNCTPNFLPGQFGIIDNNATGPTVEVAGGCDNDENFDAGETVTYGIALLNRGRGISGSGDDYNDVTATLTPSGPGVAAIRVLDSPKNIGRLPANASNGVFFHVFVDAATANGLPLASRKVTMTLTLDSLNKGQRLDRQTFTFNHAINADRQTLHYSTDYPQGGVREVRDLNRNLVIDKPDQVDPFLNFIVPDEDVTFSSMFVPGTTIGGTPTVTNVLGEDLNNNGVLDGNEVDIIPNGVLDRGILFSGTGPSSGDKVPWHFDTGNGGFVPVRHPGSSPGTNIGANPVWEYVTSGLCGFQSSGAGLGHYGIWHSGDGNPLTPGPTATACDNHGVPGDLNTAAKVEVILDVLHSPIIAKVHQQPDSLGFDFGVEFQRLGLNLNDQEIDASYNGVGVNIDNNLDEDGTNCIFCQELDSYYTRRFGGWPRTSFDLAGYTAQYFGLSQGINPASTAVYQRTFGPFTDPNAGTPFDGGGETGFSGFTQNNDPASTSPIPTAPPSYLKFPLPGAPVPGVCSGGPTPGGPCQSNTDCGSGGTCTLESISLYGPVRNFDASLVGFEGGLVADNRLGLSAPERDEFYTPGTAGNRWAIAFGFYGIESGNLNTDYGWGIDDVVFEWDEFHPADEASLGHSPACSRFNTPGNPAGGQCATITADRTNLYECEESMEITVEDPKLPSGDPTCSPAPCVKVEIVTDSDSNVFSTKRFTVLEPNAKRYTLPAVAGSPGFFRGTVAISGTANTPNNVFTNPSTDGTFIVYYVDPGCDGDGDGQAGESFFDNLDGDGVAAAVDNCPLIYNQTQADADHDGIGDLCDNCVNVANPGQEDSNNDNVGDACEYDDVDGDGVGNETDNCPDVYNPLQEPGTGNRGAACSSTSQDLDGDTVNDNLDNCVLTPNGNQKNSDGDGLGDACDGDCVGITIIHICANSPTTVCVTDSQCPASPAVPGPHCQTAISHSPSAVCSTVNDDADVDGVPDNVDNCADIYNPPIIPGTFRQLDSDRDGLGDACDPSGSLDDDFNGVPDDLVTFTGVVSCRVFPLAKLAVLDADYVDLDGDHDPFPDTGETGIVQVRVKNLGFSLTDAAFTLTSSDPNVGCIISPTVSAASVPANSEVVLGSLDPAAPQLFKFRASDSLNTTNPASPVKINLCLAVTANEALGTATPACFQLLADISAPAGTLPYVIGPDGIAGTADDGTVLESFDLDRDHDGKFTVNDTFLSTDTGTGATAHGFYVHGSATGVGTDVVAGTACGGFLTPAQGNPGCILDPDFPMDWHFHCPPSTPLAQCPNTESGSFTGGVKGGCTGGCSYQTPTDGAKAFTPPNSLHMGAHFDLALSTEGDTTHFRALQAFVSAPINVALGRRVGHPEDLTMSFYHIVDLMDNEGFGPGNANQCADCADVQIQSDRNPDPAVDDWGPWDKLVPSVNVYDHKVQAWSIGGVQSDCVMTPTDTGTAPPAPRGVHETICYPQGAWSHCGHPNATTPAVTVDCPAPGVVDPSGKGVWVQTAFNLKPFLGARVRIRWIGESWGFLDPSQSSYFETGPGWSTTANDDGWWLDNITIGGVLTKQVLPVTDTRPAPATACPTSSADFCNENATSTDKGTLPQIKATDLNGNIFDGVNFAPVAGQNIRVSAVASTIPGGCTNGVPQFQFIKNGTLAQDWSSKTFFQDSPEGQSATYTALVRCSSDTSCTSLTGASVTVPVYTGTDGDIVFGSVHSAFDPTTGVQYDRTALTTTLNLESAGAAFPVDVYKGTITAPGTGNGAIGVGPSWQHAATSCFLNNLAVVATNVTSGALNQAADANPAVGTATFYVANASPAGVLNGGFGCVNPGRCSGGPTPNASCAVDLSCGAGGTCLSLGQAGALNGNPLTLNFGCPTAIGSPYRVGASSTPASATACKP